MTRKWQGVKILVFLQLILLSFAQFGAAQESLRFRCMRPFSSLTHFKSSEMHVHERCRFGSFVIINASATPRCTRDEENSSPGALHTGVTCTAHMDLTFAMAPDAGHNAAVKDAYRYSMELRSVAGRVHYKGFDQNGYSVCCSLLHNATCAWKKGRSRNTSDVSEQREPEVVSCPLYELSPGKEFYGGVAKPLHENAVAKWTAQILFWRTSRDGRETLGRLQVPFFLTEEIMRSAESGDSVAMRNSALATFSGEEAVQGRNDL